MTKKSASKNNDGTWSISECTLFSRGVILHGWGQWRKVESVVKSRSNVQCKSHAQKFRKWHPDEVERLKREHASYVGGVGVVSKRKLGGKKVRGLRRDSVGKVKSGASTSLDMKATNAASEKAADDSKTRATSRRSTKELAAATTNKKARAPPKVVSGKTAANDKKTKEVPVAKKSSRGGSKKAIPSSTRHSKRRRVATPSSCSGGGGGSAT